MEKVSKIKNIKVFWLLSQMNPLFQEKNDLLSRNGYDIRVFNNIDALISESNLDRPSIIVIDTTSAPSIYIQKCIQLLSRKAELKGVRKILSVLDYDEEVYNLAASNVFRDIIPLKLEDSVWLSRFYFATSKKNQDLTPPAYQLKLEEEANISFPARITWISNSNIFIETKIAPPEGTELYLSGGFNDIVRSESRPNIVLTTRSSQNTDLLYRFSTGILTSWKGGSYPEVERVLNDLKQNNFGPKIRVFVIAKDFKLRSFISDNLDSLRFEVNVALRLQSITEEPKYFSPHIIFIEDSMCQSKESYSKIKMMLSSVKTKTTVYIVGFSATKDSLGPVSDLINVVPLQVLPTNLSRLILTQDLLLLRDEKEGMKSNSQAIYLPSDHPFSRAEIFYKARLTAVHPSCISLTTPFEITSYALCTVTSKTLSKNIFRKLYTKIYRTYKSEDNFGNVEYGADGYLCDLNEDEKFILSQNLLNLSSNIISSKDNYIFSNLSSLLNEDALYRKINTKNKKDTLISDNETESKYPLKSNSKDKDSIVLTNLSISSALKEKFGFKDKDYSIKKEKNKNPNHWNFPLLRVGGIILAMIASLYLLVFVIVNYVNPNWTKSGSEYTESLRKFAPSKFESSTTDNSSSYDYRSSINNDSSSSSDTTETDTETDTNTNTETDTDSSSDQE